MALTFHENLCDDVAALIQDPLWSILQASLRDVDVESLGSAKLARTIRQRGTPLEVCRQAFRHGVVQTLLRHDEAVGTVLSQLYHL